MITEEKMNEILLEAASQNVNMSGSKFVFKKLPTVSVHKTVYFTIQEIVEKIQKVGEILEAKEGLIKQHTAEKAIQRIVEA